MALVTVNLQPTDPQPGNYLLRVKNCSGGTYQSVAIGLTNPTDFPYIFDIEPYLGDVQCFEYYIEDLLSDCTCTGITQVQQTQYVGATVRNCCDYEESIIINVPTTSSINQTVSISGNCYYISYKSPYYFDGFDEYIVSSQECENCVVCPSQTPTVTPTVTKTPEPTVTPSSYFSGVTLDMGVELSGGSLNSVFSFTADTLSPVDKAITFTMQLFNSVDIEYVDITDTLIIPANQYVGTVTNYNTGIDYNKIDPSYILYKGIISDYDDVIYKTKSKVAFLDKSELTASFVFTICCGDLAGKDVPKEISGAIGSDALLSNGWVTNRMVIEYNGWCYTPRDFGTSDIDIGRIYGPDAKTCGDSKVCYRCITPTSTPTPTPTVTKTPEPNLANYQVTLVSCCGFGTTIQYVNFAPWIPVESGITIDLFESCWILYGIELTDKSPDHYICKYFQGDYDCTECLDCINDCFTRTPTPTMTPTNTVTPTITSTITPTNTQTTTPTPSSCNMGCYSYAVICPLECYVTECNLGCYSYAVECGLSCYDVPFTPTPTPTPTVTPTMTPTVTPTMTEVPYYYFKSCCCEKVVKIKTNRVMGIVGLNQTILIVGSYLDLDNCTLNTDPSTNLIAGTCWTYINFWSDNCSINYEIDDCTIVTDFIITSNCYSCVNNVLSNDNCYNPYDLKACCPNGEDVSAYIPDYVANNYPYIVADGTAYEVLPYESLNDLYVFDNISYTYWNCDNAIENSENPECTGDTFNYIGKACCEDSDGYQLFPGATSYSSQPIIGPFDDDELLGLTVYTEYGCWLLSSPAPENSEAFFNSLSSDYYISCHSCPSEFNCRYIYQLELCNKCLTGDTNVTIYEYAFLPPGTSGVWSLNSVCYSVGSQVAGTPPPFNQVLFPTLEYSYDSCVACYTDDKNLSCDITLVPCSDVMATWDAWPFLYTFNTYTVDVWFDVGDVAKFTIPLVSAAGQFTTTTCYRVTKYNEFIPESSYSFVEEKIECSSPKCYNSWVILMNCSTQKTLLFSTSEQMGIDYSAGDVIYAPYAGINPQIVAGGSPWGVWQLGLSPCWIIVPQGSSITYPQISDSGSAWGVDLEPVGNICETNTCSDCATNIIINNTSINSVDVTVKSCDGSNSLVIIQPGQSYTVSYCANITWLYYQQQVLSNNISINANPTLNAC